MERLDRVVGKLALPLVLAVLVSVPVAAFGYDRYLNSRVPRDAAVFWITLDGRNGWSEGRVGAVQFKSPQELRELRVRRGQEVILRLMANDVHHGFALPAFGVKPMELIPGHYYEVRFRADRAGEFPLFCTVFCGPAHERMHARLVVTP
jgi:heme/copper-type cytochrome/quinol oxidase subunit 2